MFKNPFLEIVGIMGRSVKYQQTNKKIGSTKLSKSLQLNLCTSELNSCWITNILLVQIIGKMVYLLISTGFGNNYYAPIDDISALHWVNILLYIERIISSLVNI